MLVLIHFLQLQQKIHEVLLRLWLMVEVAERFLSPLQENPFFPISLTSKIHVGGQFIIN